MADRQEPRLGTDSRLRRYDDITDMIGDPANPTPIVALQHMVPGHALKVYVKLEWMNPFGSVKDRAAKWMLGALQQRGELRGRGIVEPTSGNTGIALAALATLMGTPMTVTVPRDMSPEKDAILRMLGARVVRTSEAPESGRHPMDVAIEMAEDMVATSDDLVMPDQYDNPDNERAHYESTGPEIWEQTQGSVRYFFAGFGTSGTVVGTGRYLKERDPLVRVIAIEPVPGHHISGLKNMEETAVPGILDLSVIDEIVYVDDEMTSSMIRRLYREEALMVGPSGAAIIAGAMRYLEGREGVAVAIAPDSGQKAASYLIDVMRG